jgi:hypothetical protein
MASENSPHRLTNLFLRWFEQLVGAGHVHGAAAADGDVAQGGGQVCLPDADGYPRDPDPLSAMSTTIKLTGFWHRC